MGKFKAALDSGAGKAQHRRPTWRSARQVGANGTPNFYIDGRNVVGAQPFDEFKKVIDDELARADKLIAKGTPPGQVYAAFMKGAKASPRRGGRRRSSRAQKGPGASAEVYKVAVGDAPTKGGKQPKVTIVEFSDFQCPFCSRVNPTLEQVVEGLRRRRQPSRSATTRCPSTTTPCRRRWRPRRRASRASSGRCTTSCSPTSRTLDRPNLEKYAQEIGLDMGKFKAALDKEKGKERIKRDMDDAAKFGARGTPNFFINGRNFRGAQPLEAFKGVIDEEIKKADAKIAAGHAARQALRAAHRGGPRQGGRAAAPRPDSRRARRERPASAPT